MAELGEIASGGATEEGEAGGEGHGRGKEVQRAGLG